MIIEKLYDELLPLYEQLYADCATLRDRGGNAVDLKEYCAFCPQVGKKFPEAEREGILFVGRATNGWKSRMEFPADRVMADQLATINIDGNMAKGGFKPYHLLLGCPKSKWYSLALFTTFGFALPYCKFCTFFIVFPRFIKILAFWMLYSAMTCYFQVGGNEGFCKNNQLLVIFYRR